MGHGWEGRNAWLKRHSGDFNERNEKNRRNREALRDSTEKRNRKLLEKAKAALDGAPDNESLPNHCQSCGAWGTTEVHLRGCSLDVAPEPEAEEWGSRIIDGKVANLRRAWTDAGSNPEYHHQMKSVLKTSWPCLHSAIEEVLK